MIDIKSLRVGNLVLFENCLMQVMTIGYNFVSLGWIGGSVAVHNEVSEEDLDGCPINEYELLALGFVKDSSYWGEGVEYYLSSLVDVKISNMEGFFVYVEEISLKHIKSVHQIQNLYQCMNNEELKYEP